MLHNRQAPGRDFHKHFSLAPARSDTITASSTASATAATRNPPPHPDPYKTGPQARKATSRAPHLSLMPLSLPCPKQQSKRDRATRTANSKASATQQTTQQPQLAPPHLKPRMGTDGEGRRNPARLCTTAVRRSSSPPLSHRNRNTGKWEGVQCCGRLYFKPHRQNHPPPPSLRQAAVRRSG